MPDDQDSRPPEFGDLVRPDRPPFGKGSAFGYDLKQVERGGRGKWFALVMVGLFGLAVWAAYDWL